MAFPMLSQVTHSGTHDGTVILTKDIAHGGDMQSDQNRPLGSTVQNAHITLVPVLSGPFDGDAAGAQSGLTGQAQRCATQIPTSAHRDGGLCRKGRHRWMCTWWWSTTQHPLSQHIRIQKSRTPMQTHKRHSAWLTQCGGLSSPPPPLAPHSEDFPKRPPPPRPRLLAREPSWRQVGLPRLGT